MKAPKDGSQLSTCVGSNPTRRNAGESSPANIPVTPVTQLGDVG